MFIEVDWVPSFSQKIDKMIAVGNTKEQVLNNLVQNNKVLLHGSRNNITDTHIHPNNNGKVFATNDAGIAILKAIFSNIGLIYPGLQYPYRISLNNPLILRIHGIKKDTIGSIGYVYIIENKEGFENIPDGSWQYIKNQRVPFSDRMIVHRNDFKYPIRDVTNNRKIQ